ncbi:hypothetical protein LUZ63_011282 [Rhynchospora breviuscula]|uniref:PORR domain-containing protein n=1 Tax=Rhynchospora breviuscula TaxID=2022672 RepID=A0A9Q0CIF8_9POAL|nr:hypothetical protein LUZ63_011282 [Rhynchospora breviuscula]
MLPTRRRPLPWPLLLLRRSKTTSAQHVAARHRDPTFEKFMDSYKHYLKALPVIDLIISSPGHTLPLSFLSSYFSQRLHLNRGPLHFLRAFPHLFSISYDKPFIVTLTPAAQSVLSAESEASSRESEAAACRLHRLLSMSLSHRLPLRAVFRVWRELGLPDDFEHLVIHQNPSLFSLSDNPNEPNTHIVELVDTGSKNFTPAIESWRTSQQKDSSFEFNLRFPPGMRLTKDYRARIKAWQQVPYTGPYEPCTTRGSGKNGRRMMEKRAVGIMHEFISLTVEKMVEVEKISHFKKWFGIELNVRDLFLDHPGIFYLSTKGYRHTVFLREAYEKGRLIEPNPIYDARRRLFDLMLLRRRGIGSLTDNH